jgi:hypothetical protein
MPGLEQSHAAEQHYESELNEYRAVSAGAVFGFVMSLISSVAFIHPVLWCVPVVAATINLIALVRIKSQAPRLIGRTMALMGLSLALVFGAAAPSRYVASNFRTRYESSYAVRAWLDDVRQHRLEAAVEWMIPPERRLRPGDDPVVFYRDEPKALDAVRELAERSLVRALEKVGMNSQVRYLETSMHHSNPFKERVASIWAVTYKEQDQLKSILIRASLERSAKGPRGADFWWITKVDLVTTPPAWLK